MIKIRYHCWGSWGVQFCQLGFSMGVGIVEHTWSLRHYEYIGRDDDEEGMHRIVQFPQPASSQRLPVL